MEAKVESIKLVLDCNEAEMLLETIKRDRGGMRGSILVQAFQHGLIVRLETLIRE